jgi:hypothetical protein
VTAITNARGTAAAAEKIKADVVAISGKQYEVSAVCLVTSSGS